MDIGSPIAIAGVQFGNRLMNGAFIGSKTLEDAETLSAARSGAVIIGSISVRPRERNPGRGYWRHREHLYSLNSFGMPNGGLPYFAETLPKMVAAAHAHHKPLIANIVGFAPEEWVALMQLAKQAGADMVELNLGCPNVWKDGEQKRIVSYHADLVRDTLAYIQQHAPSMPVCVKISPLPPDILRDVSTAIAASGIVSAVTATNSYPNAALSRDTRVADEEVLAGLTGRALKPLSLGVVRQLRSLLPDSIAIIGCGGISSASDVIDYLDAGAAAVQIATGLVESGPSLFETLLSQTV